MGRGRVLLCPVTLTLGPARGQLCSCCVRSLWAAGSSGHVPRRAARREFCVGGSQASVAGPEQVRGRGGGGLCLQDTAGVSQAWGSPWESLATCRTLGPSQAGRGPTFDDRPGADFPRMGAPAPCPCSMSWSPCPTVTIGRGLGKSSRSAGSWASGYFGEVFKGLWKYKVRVAIKVIVRGERAPGRGLLALLTGGGQPSSPWALTPCQPLAALTWITCGTCRSVRVAFSFHCCYLNAFILKGNFKFFM